MSRRAIFLDRDGVLNELVLNPATGEYESPLTLEQLCLIPGVSAAAKRFQEAGFLLFIVSNQPNYAKGKMSLEETRAVSEKLEQTLRSEGAEIARSFYCLHHPDGVVPGFSGACRCRKPKPQLLYDARDQFDLDLARSWMIGDQESDVECGRRAGCGTVLVANPHSEKRRPGIETPTLRAADLTEAAKKILTQIEGER